MLQVSNLSKTYKGSDKKAVNNLSFEVKEGEIFGLLGLNGAGKSTAFKCITGIQPFDEGSVSVCGYDIIKDEMQAKQNYAFIPDNHAVFEGLTGREYITFMASVYNVDKETMNKRIDRFVEMFNSGSYLDNPIRSYSHGMKQKVAIMGGIIHYPKLWILDEPLLGLDPKSIKQIQTFMREYAQMGNSILFSSHILDTVSKMCDRVLIIDHGETKGLIDIKGKKENGENVNLDEIFFSLVEE
ncbi:MAG: ABC transporter ATP-binding protein [Clostridia bacterium]|nr:ABC transporter ATP-binding protein [Clostridia bacterium]